MEENRLFGLPTEQLLLIWHTHRLEILLSAAILLACARLAVHWRSTKSKQGTHTAVGDAGGGENSSKGATGRLGPL